MLLPSVGALNRTHLLIVPKRHVFNIASLEQGELKELERIKDSLTVFAQESLKTNLIFFEHGAGTECDSSGGCVEHAHLHVISALEGVLALLEEYAHFVKLPSFDAISRVGNTQLGYALLQDADGSVWEANNPKFPSQLFRRIYAQIQNGPEVWNWRIDPRINEVKRVIDAYKQLRLSHE